MTDNLPSDELLMAYADGMLGKDEARAVEAAMLADPAVAAQVESFRQTGLRLSALGRAQDDSVPDALIARVRELAAAQDQQIEGKAAHTTSTSTVTAPAIDLAARRQAREEKRESAVPARRVPIWQLPLAASIFLALGLWGGINFGSRDAATSDGLQLAVLDSAELKQALVSTPSGARQGLSDGAELSVIASFNGEDGQFCREFEVARPDRATIVSVACHQPQSQSDGWSTQLAVLSGAIDDDQGYVPASSLDTLDAYLGSIGAGPILSDEEEQAALAALQ